MSHAELFQLRIYVNDKDYVGGLVQDCSDSSALAMELLQSCIKPLMLHCQSPAMPPNDLEIQGTRALAGMILTEFVLCMIKCSEHA